MAYTPGILPQAVPMASPVTPGGPPQIAPYTSTTITDPSSQTTRTVQTPEYRESLTAVDRADEEQRRADAAQLELAKRQDEIAKVKAIDSENAALAAAEDTKENRRVFQERLDAARKEHERYDKEAEEQRKKSTTGFWEDKSTGVKLAAAFAQALGGYASGINGGVNQVTQMFQHAEEQDRAVKEAKLRAVIERGRAMGENEDRLTRLWEHGQRVIDSQQKADENAAIKQAEAMTASLNPGSTVVAQVNANLERNRAISRNQRLEATLDKTSSNSGTRSQNVVEGIKQTAGTGSGINGEQAKTALYAEQMDNEIKLIKNGPALSNDDLKAIQDAEMKITGAEKTGTGSIGGAVAVGIGRTLGAIPRSAIEELPPAKQVVFNAWANAQEKVTRQLTGAGMPAQEEFRMNRLMSPQAGDSAEVIQSKFRRLQAFSAQMKALSGQPAQMALDAARAQMAAWERADGVLGRTAAPRASVTPATVDAAIGQPKAPEPKAADTDGIQKWLRDNPNDPRAPAVRAKFEADAAARGGE